MYFYIMSNEASVSFGCPGLQIPPSSTANAAFFFMCVQKKCVAKPQLQEVPKRVDIDTLYKDFGAKMV